MFHILSLGINHHLNFMKFCQLIQLNEFGIWERWLKVPEIL
jgi:hypothetical protein